MQWKYSNFYFQDIVRLSGVGLSVHPKTIHRKLYTWQEMLDLKVKEMRESWAQGGSITYQLIGDNWDKNILPSSEHQTKEHCLFICSMWLLCKTESHSLTSILGKPKTYPRLVHSFHSFLSRNSWWKNWLFYLQPP